MIDTLPINTTFVKAEGTGWSCGTPSGNLLTCTYAQNLGVAPDDRVAEDLLITVKTAATLSEGDKITNLVKVSNDTKELTDLIMRDNTSELNTTIKGAMLETSVTSSADSVMEGDNVVFGFRVKNSGFTTAKNVRIRFDFDKPELVYDLTAVNLPSECRLQNKSVECNTAELSEGEAISATVEANVTDVTGDRNLTARVNADASNTNSSHAEKTIEIDDFATYAEWHFDECRISEGVKEENGDFNGKINGEVEKILDGKLCTALDFLENENGENSVSTDVDLNDLGANGTIAFWFKSDVDLDTYTPNHMHILFDASSRWRYFYLGLIKSPVNGEVYFNLLLMDAGGKNYILYPEVDMRDKIRKGEWHHIAYTFDTATHDMNIYLDGEKLPVGWYTGSSYSEWKSDLPDTGGLHIGGKANNKHPWGRKTSAAGAIDEFKIFDPLLDPETIKSIYNNEKNGKNFNGTSRTCPECTTETSVTIEPLSKIYADNDFEYRILVENNDIFPVNEINLTVDLDAQALYMESNYTTDWSCSHDEKAHRISCYFDADGNASTKCQKGICGEFTLKMRAPNSETTLTSSARITTYPKDGYLPNNEETNVSSVLPVDISISKTTDNNEPDQNQPYLYTLHISNDSGIAKNVTVTDEIESTLSITSIRSNDADWTCSTIGHTILCERAALPAVYDGDISIMVTPTIDKAIHNEANITTETAETNLGNNTAAVDVNVKSSTGAGWDKSKFKDFNLRKNRTFYGDLMVIGNSYLTGQYSDGDKLADVNTTVAQGNISEAELTLQPHMKVEFARLYWTGHLHGESGDTSEEGSDQGFKTIDFHTPDGQTHTLEANESDTFYYYYKNEFDTYRRIYSTSVDVTDIMKDVNASRGTFSGYYGVEGIKANTGKDIGILTPVIDKNGSLKNEDIKFGHFAGWNLVIFYEVDHRAHREQVYKNINIFDGFKKLIPASVGYEKLTIPVSGFITPKFGDIDSRLSLFAAGGEKTVELDSISIVSTENNISSEVKISDALNPEENVLNGTISRSGSDVTARRPHQNYNIGIDLDQFDISSDFSIDKVYFGHLQEETNITLSVGRKKEGSHEVFDQSFLSAIGISTQIYNPDFIDSYKECFVEDPQSGNYKSCSDVNITRGGEIIYRITIINTGDDRASNVVIQDPLPAEVDFNISTADLKVVTDTKPLCAGLDTRADSINSCVQHLESKGVLDHRKLTDTGKEYIRTFFNTDINASSDRLIDGSWNTGFSDYSVTTETIDEEERTKLTLDLSSVLNQGEGTEQEGYFPALNVTWVEFKVKVNTKAILNKTFGNTAVINFTNPTLAAYGYPDATQRQESTSVESPPVVFQWTALSSNIKDPSRNSVGTKIVGKPFDLNISIDDANSTFGEFAANYPDVNLTIWRIRLVDGNNSYVQIADFNRSDFTILSQEYLPIGNSMSWLTDKNISLSTAWRDIYFNIQYKIRYNDGTETKEQLSPNYYGPFGDNFAIRPEKLVFSATNSMGTSGGYLLMKAAKPFDLDVNATDASGSGSIIGYTTHLSATDITDSNVTAATVSISDQKGCIPDILNKIHLYDFNFTNGAAQRLTNVKFDDVGFVTLKVRDTDWTHVDSIKGDCNSTIDNEDNDQNDSYVSCFIKGEGRIIFIPDRIEVNTTVTNQGGGFTYMADDLDAMRTAINTVIRSLNTEGNVTQSFTGGCYADDVNMSIDANISSAESSGIDLLWKLSTDAATSLLSNVGTGPESILQIIDDSSFSNGVANISFLVDVNRTQETVAGRIIDHARYPVDMNINAGKAHIDDYLSTGTGVAESVTNYNDSDHLARFWYARAHAPDYRSNTAMTETPVFIEVFCDNSVVNCANYGISGFPESSDDVNWWINTGHSTSSMGLLYDMNATQKNTLDPYIKINGGSNTTGEINASFTGGVYTPTITYTGTSNLYKTKIEMRVSDWLKYNRINITLPMAYHVEFNLPSDDWSGIGEKGETVETNGSAKSNRRLEW
ncbi:LamG-like jellyroll fold domain-containing protein [Hydrogenimonas sp.]